MTKCGNWYIEFDITLEGEDVRFEDLSETTQEHICEMIKQGYYSGEICEEVEE